MLNILLFRLYLVYLAQKEIDMSKTKTQCPTCKTYHFSFPSDILDLLSEIKRNYHKSKGRSINNERIVIDIIREWRFIKDTKTVIK